MSASAWPKHGGRYRIVDEAHPQCGVVGIVKHGPDPERMRHPHWFLWVGSERVRLEAHQIAPVPASETEHGQGTMMALAALCGLLWPFVGGGGA